MRRKARLLDRTATTDPKRRRPLCERLETRQLLTTFLVTNTADSGPNSFRQAIIDANADGGVNAINFNIPGGGVQTIALQTPLPAVTDAVDINGYSQPGASANTLAQGDNAVLLIELNGTNLISSLGADGLDITGGNATVRGLVIDGFPAASGIIATGNAIFLNSNGNNRVVGNFLGTTPSGNAAAANGGNGVLINTGQTDTIGGSLPADRNIISGNQQNGIFITGFGPSNALIEGNYIGTDLSGTVALGNAGAGVLIQGVTGVTVGGGSAAALNLISSNGATGITITGDFATGELVQGNNIGTDVTGVAPLGNVHAGVLIDGTTASVGPTALVEGNVIAFTTPTSTSFSGAGVSIVGSPAVGNSILSNSIFGNQGLGIDLNADGVTLNHPGGPVVGPNNLQNFPVLTSATAGLTTTTVVGTLNSAANTAYTIQFFSNTTPDGTGHGQGQTFLGQAVVTTDASGNANFTSSVAAVPNGQLAISATATSSATGDTSEFAQDFLIPALPNLTLSDVANPEPVLNGALLTYTLMVQNVGPSSATGVILTDTLAASTNFVSGSATQGTVGQAGGVVTGNLGALARGATVTVTIVVRTSSPGLIHDGAGVSSTETPTPTTAFATSNVLAAADLGVAITARPDPVGLGSSLTYVVTVSNNGPDNSPVASVLDTLPTGVTLVSATPSQGTVTTGVGTVSADFGPLTSGASATLTLIVTPNQAGIITDSAQIVPQRGSIPDPNPANDSATIRTTVDGFADLGVLVTANADPAPVATAFSYTITVTNAGPAIATNVTLADQLPSQVSFESVTTSQGTVSGVGGTVSGNLGVLGPGQSATVTVQVFVNTAGALSNIASVASFSPDSNPSNNTFTLVTQGIFTFVVLNTNDSGFGSLRQAILNSNAHPGADFISFDIGKGFPTLSIEPTSPLPPIIDPATIDATTQPGFLNRPIVEVDGELMTGDTTGFVLPSGGTTIRGLAINRFGGAAIAIGGGNANTIQGNEIGTDRAGTVALPNGSGGIVIAGSSGNQIGGTAAGAGNLISGNEFANILLAAGANNNTISGNLIGPDSSGGKSLSNSSAGILVQNAPTNIIGGSNTISGNFVNILMTGAGATGNVIQGNKIGTDPSGFLVVGDSAVGIFVEAPGNSIVDNQISGNTVGLRLYSPLATQNSVTGNFVGTDASGNGALGNRTDGIFIDHASGNTVGGLTPAARNVISGNQSVGLQIFGPNATGNVVLGNYVGLNASGTAALPNGTDGIYVDQAPGNSIGGTVPGSANVVSGNRLVGLQIFGEAAKGNIVQGNRIGTDPSGSSIIGNAFGIYINDAGGNTVGGAGSLANTLRGNAKSDLFATPMTVGPVVQSVAPQSSGNIITSIVITFNKELDPSRAQNLRNYAIRVLRSGPAISIASAVYTTGVRTVTLSLAQAVTANQIYRLTITGRSPFGVTDLAGHFLSGNSTGRPGGVFATRVGNGVTPQAAQVSRRATTPTGPLRAARTIRRGR
jgi:uncharacterized repeat protein (TIGR01451 family)